MKKCTFWIPIIYLSFIYDYIIHVETYTDDKVLLHECKRHTTHGIVNARQTKKLMEIGEVRHLL